MGNQPAGLRLADILQVRDQTDEHGRLLLEDSASKRARKDAARNGIAMETARCPYEDTPSRVGGLMNVSAYEAIREDLAQVLDGFAWLTRNYLEAFPERASTPRALYDTSHLGLSLPLLLFHRGDDPVPPYKALPSYVASLFKASRGVFSAALDLLNQKGPFAEGLTAGQVLEFADTHKHLMRAQTGRACAAPTRLVVRALGVVLTGEGADAGRSRLPDLVPFVRLYEFYSIEDAFGEAMSRYRFILASLAGTDTRVRPRDLFDLRVPDAGGQTVEDLSMSLVAHANSLQVELNRVLGRSGTARPLSFDDLVSLL